MPIPKVLYHVSPSYNRPSIERLGLSVRFDQTLDGRGNGAVFLTDLLPPPSPSMDVWAVQTEGLEVQDDWTWQEVEYPGGAHWYCVFDDIPSPKLISGPTRIPELPSLVRLLHSQLPMPA